MSTSPLTPVPFTVARPDTTISGEHTGLGRPLVLLHGLTATRRYVLHGSTALARDGHVLISFDARGHGASLPAGLPGRYHYDALGDDAAAVMTAQGVERAVLVGQSMGSATAINVALRHPARVAGLVIITPAHRGAPSANLDRWDALADGLETGGVDGFLAAYGPLRVPASMRDAAVTVLRQRLERHLHPDGVVAALRGVPRSAAFDGLDALSGITVPTLIIASRDDMDPEHPREVAEEYRQRIPNSDLIIEDPGQSPLAWRGGSLSRAVAAFLAERAGALD
jgi:pimeloyl-ACP methyl ester carboxylesterase